MAQLRQDYQKFIARNAEIIAVGPEDTKAFSDFWIREKMPFTGIPDPRHSIAKLFGQKVNLLKLGRMPALIVIDKEGMIRYLHYGDSMSDIPSDEDILSLLDGLNKEPSAQ
jgi:peroxiredoxin